ncbi:hypothetical protein [Streptomyces sp. NPDC051211]
MKVRQEERQEQQRQAEQQKAEREYLERETAATAEKVRGRLSCCRLGRAP